MRRRDRTRRPLLAHRIDPARRGERAKGARVPCPRSRAQALFDFLHRELGVSAGAAFYRKTAAQLIQKYPEIVEPLRDGRLCITSVGELAKVITPENRETVLPRFFHVSRSQAKSVSAELCPSVALPRRDVVTRVARAEPLAHAESRSPDDLGQAFHRVKHLPEIKTAAAPIASPGSTAPPAPARERRDEVEPLTGDLDRLHVTISRSCLAKLEAARSALSHSHPGATKGEILEAALDLLLAHHAKRKGFTDKPRREPPPSSPAHVPAHVKRAVWKRDGGRCQWPVDGGGICGSTHQVELDHVVPRGKGGPSTIDNIRLLCDVHNQYAARLAYGDAWMDRFTQRPNRTVFEGQAAGPPQR